MTALVAFMTARDRDEARRIAHILVEERLAACCNIVEGVTSIYRWEGAVEESTEALVIIKTTEERLPDLARRIPELHSYDVPELIALPITGGSAPYLAWLLDGVRGG